MNQTIAVLIPCLNEERTIEKVVKEFREQLPEAAIHVFDNDSTDATRQIALDAGAIVHRVALRGKGNVVQHMFRAVDADICIMVDGDDTYPAEAVHDLMADVADDQADMVVGSRFLAPDSSFRVLNRLGNQLFLLLINKLYGARLTDVLSGYRVMNRRFVKGLPLGSPGFEIETELTIRSLERGFRVVEKPVRLRDRPEGSHSKLRKFRDGWRILRTILGLLREARPLAWYGTIGVVFVVAALVTLLAGPGLATAVLLAVGLLSVTAGVVVQAVNRRFRDLETLHRLQIPSRRRRPTKRRAGSVTGRRGARSSR